MAAESKTEAPTFRRRESAREEGRVAVSRDLTAGLSLLAACVAARRCWTGALQELAHAAAGTFHGANPTLSDAATLGRLLHVWEMVALRAVLPVLAAGMVTGLLVGLAQTRVLFSLKPLAPRLDKLNPANGIKRILSLNGLVEAIKGGLKVALVMGVALGSMWARREDLMRLAGCSTQSSLGVSVDLIVSTITRCAAVLAAIGIADYAYQWWQHEKGLRMSRQDILDELKQTEGDPRMRSRRKALRRNMLQQGITSQAKRASVVITNPTHLAVALLYRPGMFAPRVVAKGRHVIAERIVALAGRHNVPVVQNLEVARALYKASGIGDYIPGALFQAVAEILAVLVRRAEERKRRFAGYHRAPARQPAPPAARIP